MKILTKSLFWFLNIATCLMVLIIIAGGAVWLVMKNQANEERKLVAAATVLVRQKINYRASDVWSGCVHPDNGVIIVSVNGDIFFGVKNGAVFIPRLTSWYNDRAKIMAPDLAIEEHQINPYYLLEYCR